MGRPKKENSLKGQVLDPLEEEEKKLEAQLKKVQTCNKLIKAQNPFSVDIPDKGLLGSLIKNFREFIKTQILLTQEGTDGASRACCPASGSGFSDEEVKTLKMFAKRAVSVATPNKKEKKIKTGVDLESGDRLLIKSKAVFDKGVEGRVLLAAGERVFFNKSIDNDLILVIDEEGCEGKISKNKVVKEGSDV